MTKVYLGNDEYEVYFDSGKMLIFTEDEINELVVESGIVEDLNIDIEDYKNEIKSLQDDKTSLLESHNATANLLQEAKDYIEELEDERK